MNDLDIDLRKLSAIELVVLLDKAHPPRCIQKGETLEDAQRYAAVREWIDELVAIKDEDEDRA